MEENNISYKQAAAGSKYEKEKQYWLNIFSDDFTVSNFMYDYALSDEKSYEAASIIFEPENSVSKRLEEISNNSDLKLHILLTTGLFILHYLYGNNEDIVIGTPVLKQDTDRELINTILPLHSKLKGSMKVKELIMGVRKSIIESTENQNYPIQTLPLLLQLPNLKQDFSLFNSAILLENIHEKEYIDFVKPGITFICNNKSNKLSIELKYNATLYKKRTIERIKKHYCKVLTQMIADVEAPLSKIELISEEEKELVLKKFNQALCPFPKELTIPELFAEQVQKYPDKCAIKFYDRELSYRELDQQSSQLANYLIESKGVAVGEQVAILMDRAPEQIIAMLAILKAGAAYLPIEITFPEERLKTILEDAKVGVVISEKRFIRTLNRLQWECKAFHSFVCLDSSDINSEDEMEQSELSRKGLWEYVGDIATDDITGGGWLSSYTGEPLSREEMDEYGDNILKKLKPLLNKEMRILEIGCASGISMFRLAPEVKYYYGCDLSGVIIEKNRERIENEGISNIELACLPAHEVDKIEEGDFDLIIINSVIQCFNGHNYLRKVLKMAVDKLKPKGRLFLGDLMDQELKESMIDEYTNFKLQHKDKGYKTKLDWQAELFLSRDFLNDLLVEIPAIQSADYSGKIYTIENELTKFRYDALLTIDKNQKKSSKDKNRYQDDMTKVREYSNNPPERQFNSDTLAYTIYTSGTSGKPKGSLINHYNVGSLVKNINYADITPDDKILQLSNYAFDGSVFDIFASLLNGATLVMSKKETLSALDQLSDLIIKENISVFLITTALFNTLVDYNIETFDKVKRVIFGGEEASVEHARKLLKRLGTGKVVNAYGPTEGTVYTTFHPIEELPQDLKSIPIGKPTSNTTVYIVDKDLKLLPPGIAGEILTGGEGISEGYLNQPELTAEKFVYLPFSPGEKLYRTGDLGRFLDDGSVEFLGRIDNQVKIRGFRIELSEIEKNILKHENIKEAVVIAFEKNDLDRYLTAYYVADKKLDPAELREYMVEELPNFMVPAYFLQLDELPLTPNGKLNKRILPKPQSVAGKGYIAPRNEIEKCLVKIWAELLNQEEGIIGIDDNFFELGGHSLKATVMITKLHEQLNIRVPLAVVFQSQTIRELAMNLEEMEQETYIAIKPVEKREYYPQSSAQKRLFILDKFENIETAYNVFNIIPVSNDMDMNRLEKAINKLIERHEILRTYFTIRDNEPVQIVVDKVDYKLEEIAINEDEVEEKEVNRIVNDFNKPFDLSKAPHIRIKYVRYDDEIYLLFNMHHIITDGTSLSILFSDLLSLYMGEELPPLNIQYKDYSCWQNDYLKSEEMRRQESFWLNLFADNIPRLNLPLDFPRPNVFNYEGDQVSLLVNRESTESIKKLSLANGSTLFMTMMAALNVLFYKYTGQEDMVIGHIIAGRHQHDELQNVMGFFINTLAVRNYPTGELSFKEFLEQVKENCIQVFENQDAQFEELVDKLSIERDPSRNPLFDVCMVIQNFKNIDIDEEEEEERYSIEEMQQEVVDQETEISVEESSTMFDLDFDISEEEDCMLIALKYCTALFKKETALRICKHLDYILKQVSENSNIKLDEIDITLPEEKKQILEDFNSTSREYLFDKTIVDLFEESAAKHKNKVAAIFNDKQITYSELNNEADLISSYLESNKFGGANAIVGILMEKSIDVLKTVFAVWKSGAAYIALDPDQPSSRLNSIIDDVGLNLLITDSSSLSKAEELREGSPLLDSLLCFHADGLKESAKGGQWQPLNLADYSDWQATGSAKGSDLAYIIYTSGSTGKPKGVMVNHSSYSNVAQAWRDVYNLKDGAVNLLQVASITFDVFLGDIARALINGGRLIMCSDKERLNLEMLYELLDSYQVTIFESTPGLIIPLMDYIAGQDLPLNYLKMLIIGADVCNTKDYRAIQFKFGQDIKIINSYGVTEGTIDSTFYDEPFDAIPQYGAVPIGKALPNMTTYVMDKNCNLLPIGVAGELCIGGLGVAAGYYKNSELTAERFIDNPYLPGERLYRTGDLVRWLPDGNIEFLGRLDFQVKIRGYRIETGEIETHLKSHPALEDAVVVDKSRGDGEKYLCAYIVTTTEKTEGDLKRYLEDKVPDYMIPEHFIFLEQLPLSSNGKIDRKALPEPTGNYKESYKRPQGELELELALIWASILGLDPDKISRDANFFEIGGHSLKATLLFTEIKKKMDNKFPFSRIFKSPTIEELAQFIKKDEDIDFNELTETERKAYILQNSPNLWYYYLLEQLSEQKSSLNRSQLVTLEGELQRERLNEALAALMKRESELNATYHFIENRLYRKDESSLFYEINYLEMDEKDVLANIKSYIKPFKLNIAPLLNLTLFKVGQARHLLLLDIHPILLNREPVQYYLNTIMALYSGENVDMNRPTEKKRALFSKDKDRLDGISPLLPEGPLNNNFTMDSLSRDLPTETVAQLKELETKNKVDLNSFILAAYCSIYSTYQDDNRVSLAVSSPDYRLFECKVNQDKSFKAQLKEVNSAYKKRAQAAPDLSLLSLNSSSLSTHVSFEELSDYRQCSTASLKVEPIELTIPAYRGTKLNLKVSRDSEQVTIYLEYNSTLFSKDWVEQYLNNFIELIKNAAHAPELKLDKLTSQSIKAAQLDQASTSPGQEEIKVPALYDSHIKKMEELVQELWQDVLNRELLEADKTLAELGGREFDLLQLSRGMKKLTSFEIPLSSYLSHNTIEKQARLIIKKIINEKEESYISYNKGSNRNIFTFPPGSGYGTVFRELSSYLDLCNLYAFNFIENSEDVVADYIKEILAIQPEGPFYLMGYSSGGNTAFELCLALEKAGHKVSDLILIDSMRKGKTLKADTQLIKEYGYQIGSHDQVDNADRYGQLQLIVRRTEKVRQYNSFFSQLESKGNIKANIHLITSQSDENKEDYGESWKDATSGKYNLYQGYGLHDDMLTKNKEKNSDIIKLIVNKIIKRG